MDPITTAVIAALSAGVLGAVTDTSKQIIVDAYNSLKSLIKQKFGDQDKVIRAIDDLEEDKDSKGQQQVLQERIAKAKADHDPEILQAAKALIEQIKAQPGGEQHIQNAIGSYIAQADRASTATVNVNQSKEE